MGDHSVAGDSGAVLSTVAFTGVSDDSFFLKRTGKRNYRDKWVPYLRLSKTHHKNLLLVEAVRPENLQKT